MRGLDGRVAVVTGGGSGIGQAICHELSRRGVRVAVLDKSPAEETLELLAAAGTPGLAVQADVTSFASVMEAASSIRSELGDPDFLVNNAGGIVERRLLLEIDDALWDECLALNLTASFHTIRAFTPSMVRKRAGSIVNIAATSVRFVWPGAAHYQVAKAGLAAFTRSIAYELGFEGIRANSVSPGTIETPRVTEAFLRSPRQAADEAEATALGRVGQPEEVAAAVAFLLSDEAAYITGAELLCDGGYSLTGQPFVSGTGTPGFRHLVVGVPLAGDG